MTVAGTSAITELWAKTKAKFAVKSDAVKSITRDGTTFTATKADGTTFTFTQQDNNTWRGIQDNLTSSTNTTESLSAKQGYLLANGSARDSTKLPLSGGVLSGNLTIKKQTAATNTYADANPKIIFQNADASQNASLTFSDYDSVQSPASITLNGNQGGEYFIAPNIKATSNIYVGSTAVSLSGHTHNNIVSRGNVTCETTTTLPAVAGLSMSQVYNNGYPTAYGNVITVKGSGSGQLLIGWSGTSGASAPVYVRSKRDTSDANWSDWAQIYTTVNKPTYSDIGAAAASHTHSYLPLSGGTVTGTLILSSGTDAEGTANNKPALIIGGTDTTAHIEIDTNEVMAKASGTSTGPLYLNNNGGIVYIGSGGVSSSGDINSSAGYLRSTKNGNTVTIGSQNSGWCHFQNSANIPFHFSHPVSATTRVEVYNSQTDLTDGKLHLKNGNIQYNATTQALDFIFS